MAPPPPAPEQQEGGALGFIKKAGSYIADQATQYGHDISAAWGKHAGTNWQDLVTDWNNGDLDAGRGVSYLANFAGAGYTSFVDANLKGFDRVTEDAKEVAPDWGDAVLDKANAAAHIQGGIQDGLVHAATALVGVGGNAMSLASGNGKTLEEFGNTAGNVAGAITDFASDPREKSAQIGDAVLAARENNPDKLRAGGYIAGTVASLAIPVGVVRAPAAVGKGAEAVSTLPRLEEGAAALPRVGDQASGAPPIIAAEAGAHAPIPAAIPPVPAAPPVSMPVPPVPTPVGQLATNAGDVAPAISAGAENIAPAATPLQQGGGGLQLVQPPRGTPSVPTSPSTAVRPGTPRSPVTTEPRTPTSGPSEGANPRQTAGDLVIVGAGNGGMTLLADTLLHAPHLNPRLVLRRDPSRDRIAEMVGPVRFNEMVRGGTHETEFRPEHFGHLYEPSGTEAIRNADTIFVTVPDIPKARLPLYEHLAENIGDGKTLALTGSGAQPAFARIVQQDPRFHGTNFALFENLPYGTRWKAGATEIDGRAAGEINGKRKLSTQLAFWGNEPETLADMRELFPLGAQIGKPSWPELEVVPYNQFAFQLGYMGHTGIAYHPHNLELTRQGIQFPHWWGGAMEADPSLAARLDAVDRERVALTRAYGLPGEDIYQRLQRMYGLEPRANMYDEYQATRPFYKSTGEPSLEALVNGRFTTEEYPSGLRALWMADRANVEMPQTRELMEELADSITRTGREVGIDNPIEYHNLHAYRNILEGFEGGVPEVNQLLNRPYVHRWFQ